MLSIRKFHIVKYSVIISLYQGLFYFNGTNYSSYLLLLNISFLVVCTLGALLLNRTFNKFPLNFNQSDLLVLVFFVGYLSSVIKGAISLNTSFILALYLILIWTNIKIDSRHNPKLFESYVNGIVLIIIVNIILFFVGISSSLLLKKYPEMPVRLVQSVGLNLNRFNFLIFSNFAYTSMLYCIPLIFFRKRSKNLLNVFVFFITVISLIFLDARGPFLAAIFVFMFGRLFYNLSLSKQFFLISGIAIIPFIVYGIIISLNINELEILSLLSRRHEIWYLTISNYSPNLFELIFGYGYIGQYSSGISELYSNIFTGWGNQDQISVHNSYLQILLDYGLLGIVLLVITIRKLFKRFKEQDQFVLYLVLLFLLFCGVTDLSIQPNNINMLTAFLIIANAKFV